MTDRVKDREVVESGGRRAKALACFLQPAFVLCVVVLALAAVFMPMIVKASGVYLKHEPFPLRKPLDLLDENKLLPYEVASKSAIENVDVVETLGTRDYISWQLEDTRVPSQSPVRYCSLFITYYELPDKVPHVPEECYTGGGFQRLSAESLGLTIDRNRTNQEVPVRCVTFSGTSSSAVFGAESQFLVLYVFRVNGEYAGERGSARMLLNKGILSKRLYFSKVEWKFYGHRSGRVVFSEKQEAIAASEKLLGVILPVLEGEHWPEHLDGNEQ